MAKMFYTLEEAAQELGKDTDTLKQMASSGQLQQFRDRDKLMFKRDQIDSLAGGGAGGGGDAGGGGSQQGGPSGDSGETSVASGETSVGEDTGIPLSDSGDTDAIDLKSDTVQSGQSHSGEDKREATGVSVFDTSEVHHADPSAQTQVNEQQDEELALESVGSGSGLLDLTRESDDTSLGAELLDEIYPSGESSDQKSDSVAGSSGVFEGGPEGTAAGESAAGGPSGLENLGEPSPTEPTQSQPSSEPATATATAAPAEAYDPAGSGLGTGLFIGTTVTLVLGLIVVISAIARVDSGLTQMMTANDNSLVIWVLGLLVGSAILGIIGLFVGRAVSS